MNVTYGRSLTAVNTVIKVSWNWPLVTLCSLFTLVQALEPPNSGWPKWLLSLLLILVVIILLLLLLLLLLTFVNPSLKNGSLENGSFENGSLNAYVSFKNGSSKFGVGNSGANLSWLNWIVKFDVFFTAASSSDLDGVTQVIGVRSMARLKYVQRWKICSAGPSTPNVYYTEQPKCCFTHRTTNTP